MKWTEDMENFLVENYPVKSNGVIDDIRNLFDITITPSQLYRKATNLKLKVSKDRKRESYAVAHRKYKYPDFSIFKNIKDVEVAYLMGLFWADGYINEKTLSIEMVKEDLEKLLHVFTSLGEWDISIRIRNNRKEQMSIKCHDHKIKKIFEDYGYKYKSFISPKFISTDINSDITKSFLLGWFDGDGCIYTTPKQNQAYFCGSYEQNWTYVSLILDKLNIKYSIKQKVQKNGKFSVVYLGGKENIKRFLTWIYSTKIKGLPRKYNKYLSLK
jgi:DNA-binding transcriptional regulator WhiA